MKTNNLDLHLVEPYSSGEGLPYAPIDWPNSSDTWRWLVNCKTFPSSFYLDRFLYLPKRLRVHDGNDRFGSKSLFKQYISSYLFFFSFLSLRCANLHPDLSPQVPSIEIASKRRQEALCNSKRMKTVGSTMSQALPRRSTQQCYKIPAQANTKHDESVIDLCDLLDDSTSDENGYSK
ncbi:hypothetical protein ACJRO7_032033 [Eucalyptus globulus]|uniref:DUF7081 domain-containing protein n=1 Tax=Eucalyptus globulus TaxID=34317 RepID=A0ABD3JIL9_EUCGL